MTKLITAASVLALIVTVSTTTFAAEKKAAAAAKQASKVNCEINGQNQEKSSKEECEKAGGKASEANAEGKKN